MGRLNRSALRRSDTAPGQPQRPQRRVFRRHTAAFAACLLIFGLIPAVAHAQSPSITSMWPRKGPIGRAVFIRGAGFTNTTDLEFNGVQATFAIRSDNRIRAIVPQGATTGHITVTADSSTATIPQRFVVQPNIVLILTDDQRFGELDHMPTVQNELIDKGTTFSNGYVVNPSAVRAGRRS